MKKFRNFAALICSWLIKTIKYSSGDLTNEKDSQNAKSCSKSNADLLIYIMKSLQLCTINLFRVKHILQCSIILSACMIVYLHQYLYATFSIHVNYKMQQHTCIQFMTILMNVFVLLVHNIHTLSVSIMSMRMNQPLKMPPPKRSWRNSAFTSAGRLSKASIMAPS